MTFTSPATNNELHQVRSGRVTAGIRSIRRQLFDAENGRRPRLVAHRPHGLSDPAPASQPPNQSPTQSQQDRLRADFAIQLPDHSPHHTPSKPFTLPIRTVSPLAQSQEDMFGDTSNSPPNPSQSFPDAQRLNSSGDGDTAIPPTHTTGSFPRSERSAEPQRTRLPRRENSIALTLHAAAPSTPIKVTIRIGNSSIHLKFCSV